MRVNPRDTSVFQGSRKGAEPALWLPLLRILTPELLIHVARLVVREHQHATRDDKFREFPPVGPAHGMGEREDVLLGSPRKGGAMRWLREDFKRLNVHAAGHHDRSMNTKRLTTNSVQVRKLDQVIVCDVGVVTTLSFDDLGAELVLNIRVLGEEVKDTRECVRRSVHAGKNEGPGWERLVYIWTGTLLQKGALLRHLRHLRLDLLICHLLVLCSSHVGLDCINRQ